MDHSFQWLKESHIHVVGLGLMGASLARALRGKVAHLSGSDIRPDLETLACQDHVVDSIGGVDQADVVIIAVPSHYIISAITQQAYKAGAVVMDMGSSKQQICRVMDNLPATVSAVGGHPMCGLAENGYHNAIPTLYYNARFILCETIRTTEEARVMSEQLVTAIGAIPIWMERDRHDELAGAISHLPHMMSFALMRLAMEIAQKDDFVWEMAAGGFDGATRLARTDEAMIMGMFRTNADQLRQLVTLLHKHLDELTALLDDPDTLRQELSSIVEARRAYTQHFGERMIT